MDTNINKMVHVHVMGCELPPRGFAIPDYSGDIEKAMTVMEKMENDGWTWEAHNVVPNSDPIVYRWRFVKADVNNWACEFTLPHAICQAALYAVLPDKVTTK